MTLERVFSAADDDGAMCAEARMISLSAKFSGGLGKLLRKVAVCLLSGGRLSEALEECRLMGYSLKELSERSLSEG